MSIQISEQFQEKLKQRQRTKFEAIRKVPIYDREIYVPVRGTKIRCLEYIPKSEKAAFPVVFDVHGGGFTNGYPEEDDYFCRQVCDQLGVRVFSIDYRLAPEYPYPEGQLDTYETIAWIHDHYEEYGILPDKMAACGHSAGGNLVLTSAMRAVTDNRFSFCGLILDYPPLDMATPAADKFYIDGAIPMELSDLFNSCYCLPGEAKEALCSPLFSADDLLQKLPPTTLISCEIDSLREEEEKFASRLIANGVEVTMRRFVGQKHAFTIVYDNPAALEAHKLMINSIERYLK